MTIDEAVAYWKNEAIRRVGAESLNAVYELRFAFATLGGTFAVAFNDISSDAIDFPPSAAELTAAMVAMPSVGAAGVRVRGVLRGPYEIEFTGASAGQEVPPLLVDGTELDPPQEVIPVLLQQGETGDYVADVAQYWDNHADTDDYELRSLQCSYDLIHLLLGRFAHTEYDVQSGQVNTVTEKRSQRYSNMRERENAIARQIQEKASTIGIAARRPFAGRVANTPDGNHYGVLNINPFTGRIGG